MFFRQNSSFGFSFVLFIPFWGRHLVVFLEDLGSQEFLRISSSFSFIVAIFGASGILRVNSSFLRPVETEKSRRGVVNLSWTENEIVDCHFGGKFVLFKSS